MNDIIRHTLEAAGFSLLTCRKCGASSGGNWSQCKKHCPMPQSPHYSWLARIEALRPGDACEVKDTLTGAWVPAIVVHNGGAGYWEIKHEDGCMHMPYIEHVRCPGQTEAWPR